MKVFHTTDDAAKAILSEGFRDGSGTYMTAIRHSGVWIADQPLDDGRTPRPTLGDEALLQRTHIGVSRRGVEEGGQHGAPTAPGEGPGQAAVHGAEVLAGVR